MLNNTTKIRDIEMLSKSEATRIIYAVIRIYDHFGVQREHKRDDITLGDLALAVELGDYQRNHIHGYWRNIGTKTYENIVALLSMVEA